MKSKKTLIMTLLNSLSCEKKVNIFFIGTKTKLLNIKLRKETKTAEISTMTAITFGFFSVSGVVLNNNVGYIDTYLTIVCMLLSIFAISDF